MEPKFFLKYFFGRVPALRWAVLQIRIRGIRIISKPEPPKKVPVSALQDRNTGLMKQLVGYKKPNRYRYFFSFSFNFIERQTITLQAVLRIRIRSDPDLFLRSGSDHKKSYNKKYI